MDHVGIDTCSAVSVSTETADFLFVDRSYEAKNSISLNGVGNGGPVILGRGPMVISSLNASGEQIFMVDPAGVILLHELCPHHREASSASLREHSAPHAMSLQSFNIWYTVRYIYQVVL